MNAGHILDALGAIGDEHITRAKELDTVGHAPHGDPRKKARRLRRTIALIAAALALSAFCGAAAYELGIFDTWLQKPSPSPVETVRSAIAGQMDKGYTISVRIDEIAIDGEETRRVVEMYSGSDLVRARGWTDAYLAEHFIVVKATYYVEYDHTKTFMNDGLTEQYFYLTQDIESGEWTIADNTSPST